MFLQAPAAHLRHGDILGYYLGYKVANSTEPFRYQTLEAARQGFQLRRFRAEMAVPETQWHQ